MIQLNVVSLATDRASSSETFQKTVFKVQFSGNKKVTQKCICLFNNMRATHKKNETHRIIDC